MIVAWCVSLLSLGALVAAAAVLVRVSRACAARRLSERMRGSAMDAPGGIGISVLYRGAVDAARIAGLLAEEYAFCEVIAVIDRERHPALYAELAARYALIPVTPPAGVRELRRSRRRNFRRLVLADRAETSADDDYGAALRVAAYDYVLPLHAAAPLLPGAIRRLAAAVAERPAGHTAIVRTRVGPPVRLFARETAAEVGFGRRAPRRVDRACRVALWEPLADGSRQRSRRARVLPAAIVAALCGAAAALGCGCLPAAVAASTAACCLAALRCVRAMTRPDTGLPDAAAVCGREREARRRCGACAAVRHPAGPTDGA